MDLLREQDLDKALELARGYINQQKGHAEKKAKNY